MKQIRYLATFLLCLAGVSAEEEKDKQIKIDKDTFLIDVRSAEEYKNGHIENAINIPHTEIGEKITDLTKDKKKHIVVYCRSGNRASKAKKVLDKMGYKNVENAGAYEDLKKKEKKE